MNGILDSMLQKPQEFVLESVPAYIALQLARQLNDIKHLRKYLVIVEHNSLSTIIEALTRARANDDHDRTAIFEEELLLLSGKEQDYAD